MRMKKNFVNSESGIWERLYLEIHVNKQRYESGFAICLVRLVKCTLSMSKSGGGFGV